jgi:enoyl-CoA hydratase/carnithine racemase
MLSSTLLAPGIRELDFNRPDKHNALTSTLYRELEAALRAAQADPEARAVILTATGKSFCAGNDLAEFDTEWPQPPDGPVLRFLTALHELDVPVLAAVHGGAIGIGATLLLQCDVVFAAPSAYLRFPFIDLGIVLEGGSSHFLFEWLGRPRAMEILLSGRKVAAAEAASLGLISRITENPAEAVRAFAVELASKSASAVRATKRLVRRSLQETFPQRFADELIEVNRQLLKLRETVRREGRAPPCES